MEKGKETAKATATVKEKRKIMPGGGRATWSDSLNCIMNIDKFYCVVPGARRGRQAEEERGRKVRGYHPLLCMHI